MIEHILQHVRLICPRCRQIQPGSVDCSQIVLDEILRRDLHESIEDGFLRCENKTCRTQYPIVNGIAILVRDLPEYLNEHGPPLLARTDLPLYLEDFIHSHFLEASPFVTPKRYLGTYLKSHYFDVSDVSPLVDDSMGKRIPRVKIYDRPEASFPAHAQGLPEDVLYANPFISEMVRIFDTQIPKNVSLGLDLGCGVGRLSRELAKKCRFVIGIDLRYAAVRAAYTFQKRREIILPERVEGFLYSYYRMKLRESLPEASYIAADAQEPPFLAETFDVVHMSILIDVAADPLRIVGQADALLKPGGILIHASPYHWNASTTAESRWLAGTYRNGREGISARSVVKDMLEGNHPWLPHLSYRILEELDGVPWVLSDFKNQFVTFMEHIVVARKNDQLE